MSAEHLVKMANDIADFFRAEPLRAEAVAGIASHIEKYWTRRMQEKLLEQFRQDDSGLEQLPREALRLLAARATGRRPPTRTGSAADGSAQESV
jgi:formate dehydrogenase subunit delta